MQLQFDRSPLVQRDRARFNATCLHNAAVAHIVGALIKSYATLDRTLVVDASQNLYGQSGVGNHFGDYAVWAALAAASRRAHACHSSVCVRGLLFAVAGLSAPALFSLRFS